MANVVRSRKLISGNDLQIFENYRAIFRKLCEGVHMTVITDTVQEPEQVFGNYAKVFKMYMKRGQLDLITIAEAPDDLENFFFL